jgi:curved DNA-binding protein CbpA
MFVVRCTPMTREAAAAILGVSAFASRAEIMAAFLLRARLTHPDRFAGAPAGDIAAASREFVRVSAARDLLCATVAIERADATRASNAPAPVLGRSRVRARFDNALPLPETRVWIA